MSITIDFFFNSPRSLPELVTDVNDCLGCSLKLENDDAEYYHTRFFGMDFSLGSAEGYVNDRDLDFESFGYEIGFKCWGFNPFMGYPQLTALILVIFALYQRLSVTGILVFDTQVLLARLEERHNGVRPYLFDQVSQMDFGVYSEYLKQLSNRWRH